MPRSQKIDLAKVQASLNTTCPKCGFTITPDQVKRVDFERMECPKCGEKFQSNRVACKRGSLTRQYRAPMSIAIYSQADE